MNCHHKIISHREIQRHELDEIYTIKKAFGNYSLDSQKRWIKNKLKPEDAHFLYYKNDKLIGYLNIVTVGVKINNRQHNALGIGNVCTSEQGKGYGLSLMLEIQRILKNNNQIGLLFCKDNLLNFYNKTGWELLEPKCVKLTDEYNNVNVMISNKTDIISSLEYNGNFF